MLDTEGHIGWLGGNSKFPEKARKVGISNLVENHKAGVNEQLAILFWDRNSVRVTTGVIIFFIQPQIVFAMQKMGASQSGYPASNNGNSFHLCCFRPSDNCSSLAT